MIFLLYFYNILTSLTRKKSRIPRRNSSFNNDLVINKYVSNNTLDYDNKLEKFEMELMIKKEENELREFERIEKEIEEEEKNKFLELGRIKKEIEEEEKKEDYRNKKKANHHNCRRLKYEFELQLHDMMSQRKISPANCDLIIESLEICFDNFLKIFSDLKSNDPDLLKFESALNQKVKKILLEFTYIMMNNFKTSRNYEIMVYLDRIAKNLKKRHNQDGRLLYETAESLQKSDPNNDLLFIYCCSIRQFSQFDTNMLNLFFSLYVYFYRHISSKNQIFNFEDISLRFERLCNYNLHFLKNLLTTIEHINDGTQINNDIIVKFCKNLIEHYEKSNVSFKEYFESWDRLFSVLSRIKHK